MAGPSPKLQRSHVWVCAIALALALGCNPAHADRFDVAPWFIDVEPHAAMAVLMDQDRVWTLMLRCLDHETDVLVRRLAEPDEPHATITHFAVELQIDTAAPALLPAQTFSRGGIIVTNVPNLLDEIEDASHILLKFDDGTASGEMVFVTTHTREAVAPVRQMCSRAET